MQKETFMNKQNPPPDSNRNSLTSHIDLLLKSYKKWTGKELTDINGETGQIAEHIFNAPFALVSHDTQDDPVFNYGNKKALELFEQLQDRFGGLTTVEPTVEDSSTTFHLELEGVSQRKANEALKDAWRIANPSKVKK